jgi:hypothetical protein
MIKPHHTLWARIEELSLAQKLSEICCVPILDSDTNSRYELLLTTACKEENGPSRIDIITKAMAVVAEKTLKLIRVPANQHIENIMCNIDNASQGVTGDRRDVLIGCSDGYTFGISCKFGGGHRTDKNSSISPDSPGLGITASESYRDSLRTSFERLKQAQSQGKAFSDLSKTGEKAQIFNVIVTKTMELVNTLDEEAKMNLFRYALGPTSYVKARLVIKDNRGYLTLSVFNFNDDFNTARTLYPTTILATERCGNTTFDIHCDNGWQIRNRLRNNTRHVTTSLKWNMALRGVPDNIVKEQLEIV